MLAVVLGLLVSGFVQQAEIPRIGMTDARPTRECGAHLTDPRARKSCMDELFSETMDALEVAQQLAREDARDNDLITGGLFDAEQAFDAARIAWEIYRDAECTRRAALMMVAEDSREELVLDCRIILTRARAAELSEN